APAGPGQLSMGDMSPYRSPPTASRRHGLLERGEPLGGDLDAGRGDVLLEVPHALGAGDRDDGHAVDPRARERELSGRAAQPLGDLADARDQRERPSGEYGTSPMPGSAEQGPDGVPEQAVRWTRSM